MAGDLLHDNFGKLHASHVAALTRHLVECRNAFGGDLDLFLVMTIIGERTFTARNAPDAMTRDDFLQGSVSDLEPAAINLQSIADYSGIPRETVRRKIETLLAMGWIARDKNRFMTVTDQAKTNLQPLTDSSLRYLRELFAMLTAPASPGVPVGEGASA